MIENAFLIGLFVAFCLKTVWDEINKQIEAFGEVKTIAQWSRDPRCNVSRVTLAARLRNYDWPAELAITQTIRGPWARRHSCA